MGILVPSSSTHHTRIMMLFVILSVLTISVVAVPPQLPNDQLLAPKSKCTGNFQHIHDACYIFWTLTPEPQLEAVEFCKELGGELVYIEDAGENAAIGRELENSHDDSFFWSALKLDQQKCVWHWNLGLGEAYTYAQWCSESSGADCQMFSDAADVGMAFGPSSINHAWTVKDASEALPFICKAPLEH